jgi:hypothetical protein
MSSGIRNLNHQHKITHEKTISTVVTQHGVISPKMVLYFLVLSAKSCWERGLCSPATFPSIFLSLLCTDLNYCAEHCFVCLRLIPFQSFSWDSGIDEEYLVRSLRLQVSPENKIQGIIFVWCRHVRSYQCLWGT